MSPMSPRLLRPTASGFNPRSISGLALWLDAADGATLFQNSDGTVPATASSDPVGYWGDKSGNGRHAVQATAGSRPAVGSVNGRRAVNFDGTDDTLAYLQGLTSNDLTTFCVYRYDALNNGVVFDYGYTGDNTNASSSPATGFLNSIGLQVNPSGTINTRLDSTRNFVGVSAGLGNVPGTLASLAGVTAIHTAAASFGGTETRYAAHAGASLTNTGLRFNGSIWSLLSLGSRRSGGSPGTATVFMDGQICEVLLYEQNLPQSQRRKIEQYLATRWGITLAPQVSNLDAQDWINRVYANGGTVSSATAQAVNTFCGDIASAGIRDRFYRLNLFCGTGLNACLTPLYRAASLGDTPLGNATDTNVGGLFVSGNYSEATGLTAPISSSNYLDTGFTTASVPAGVYESMHMSVWHGPIAAINTDPILLGAFSGERQALQTSIRTASVAFETGRMGKTTTVLATNGVQGARSSTFLLTQRTSAISLQLYRNGVLENTNTTSVTGIGTVAIPVFVFRNNNGGVAQGDQPGFAMRHYSIGDDMTEPQVLAFYNALAAFNTALGRIA